MLFCVHIAYHYFNFFHSYRLDNLIFEAITSLREPGGSNKTTIATYIEVDFYLQSKISLEFDVHCYWVDTP